MMNKQHPQEALLLAYVDRRLDDTRRLEVESLIKEDAEARDFVALLESTRLPYQEAFNERLDKSVPDSLQATIDQWSSQQSTPRKGRFVASRFALVATLVVGIGVGFLLSHLPVTSDRGSEPLWLAQVASYHELYVRETVAGADLSADDQQLLADKLGAALDASLRIPELAQHKLAFKRGQLLQIDGQALIQLAYLPDEGTPVALCITRDGAPDAPFSQGESHNLNYVNWSRDGISYVILGALDAHSLFAAAENTAAQLL